jgi:hypothetical protein
VVLELTAKTKWQVVDLQILVVAVEALGVEAALAGMVVLAL